jgi:hypothetical protein
LSFETSRRVVSARPQVEALESRRLLAGDFNAGYALPLQLDFNRSRTGLLDRDGSGSGFTWAQPNVNGTEYDTRKLDLKIGVGILRLYSVGTNWEGANTLKNALTGRFAASSKPWVISARVNGPLPQIDQAGEQGGIIFGPDQDNFVKLVVAATNDGVGLQFVDEQRFKSGYKHSLPQTITNIGSLANVQTLDLYMSGDPDTGIVRALYRVNSGAVIELSNKLTLTGDKRGAFFANSGFAGIMASHEAVGGIDFTFDQFGIKRGVLNGEVTTGIISIGSRKTFNDVRGGAGQIVGTSVKNSGNGPLKIESLSISGTDASQFSVAPVSGSLPITLGPGESLPLKITFSAATSTALGVKTATLSISGDGKTKNVRLRGLATAGTGGENEPSLQRILDLYEIPVNVGDANPADVYLGDPPATPNDEVTMQQLQKAGDGPVIIQPLAVFGVSSNPALRFGYYEPGSPSNTTELLSVPTSDAQTVNVVANGVGSFDPGTAGFGFYSVWPGFKNTDNTVRTIYTEDIFNTFDTNEMRHIRFYPLKNSDGSVVPNAFVMANEEFPGGYDAQDFVAIVYNVKNAMAGPEIGTESLDGYPASDRLVFSRFKAGDPNFPNTAFHDQAKVRVRNTGTSALNISSLVVTGNFQLLSPTGAQTVNPGKFIDVLIQFTGGATTGVRTGALTINSNDVDEPAKVITLVGFNQAKPEGNNEAPLATMINSVFGYQTVFTNAGQTITNGGKVEAVGEEILSPYWFRANTLLPITVKQLTAFHTQNNPAQFRWFNKGSTTMNNLFSSAGVDAQTIFPRQEGNLSALAAASFTPGSTAFGFRVDNEWSDPKKNVQEQPGGGYGHHVRFFPLRNTKGDLVPDTYMMVMDYQGINYDYNDNTYIITNIRPEVASAPLPSSVVMSAPKVAASAKVDEPANAAGELLDSI